MSRIGKLPVQIPAGVKVTVQSNEVFVEGPKGKLVQDFTHLVTISVEGSEVLVKRANDSKQARSAHGLYRSLIENMVKGVTEGFSKTLMINGVGFRAEVQGNLLMLNLGFSNDIYAGIPENLNVVVEAQGKLTISGIDKQAVGEYAAQIRKLRLPEPYKGKGIRYSDEVIRRKVGKSGV